MITSYLDEYMKTMEEIDDDDDEFDFEELAGNPISAFLLMRRLYIDWPILKKSILNEQSAGIYWENISFYKPLKKCAQLHSFIRISIDYAGLDDPKTVLDGALKPVLESAGAKDFEELASIMKSSPLKAAWLLQGLVSFDWNALQNNVTKGITIAFISETIQSINLKVYTIL